jgi:serine protease Do
MKGEVVGINSQIYSRSGGYMGLSFAIPIDVAMEVVDQLRKNGKVTRGRIGVTIQELTRELAESFGLAKAEGAVISSVEKGGAADKAGLEAGDVVLKFDGKTVISSADLPRMVAMTKPGSKVQIQIWRKNTLRDITLIVAEIKEENVLAQADKNPEEAGHKTVSLTRLGVKVVALSDELKAKLQIKSGLLVEEVKKGSRNGLHAGDIILSVGNLEAQSAEQINTALKSVANGRNVALLIRRGDWVSYLAIKLDE